MPYRTCQKWVLPKKLVRGDGASTLPSNMPKSSFHKVSPPILFPSYMVFNSNTHHNVTKSSKYVERRFDPKETYLILHLRDHPPKHFDVLVILEEKPSTLKFILWQSPCYIFFTFCHVDKRSFLFHAVVRKSLIIHTHTYPLLWPLLDF